MDIERHSSVAQILFLSKQKGIPIIYVNKAKLDSISLTEKAVSKTQVEDLLEI